MRLLNEVVSKTTVCLVVSSTSYILCAAEAFSGLIILVGAASLSQVASIGPCENLESVGWMWDKREL